MARGEARLGDIGDTTDARVRGARRRARDGDAAARGGRETGEVRR